MNQTTLLYEAFVASHSSTLCSLLDRAYKWVTQQLMPWNTKAY